MIGIDTNVLLRYLLADDEVQSPLATELIQRRGEILVSNVVLVETVWTLTGKKYGVKPEELIRTLYSLFREATLRFENPNVVWAALDMFKSGVEEGGRPPDFSNVLIVCIAKDIAFSRGDVLEGVYTFGKAAQRLDGMKFL